jgi:hypothetical protein
MLPRRVQPRPAPLDGVGQIGIDGNDRSAGRLHDPAILAEEPYCNAMFRHREAFDLLLKFGHEFQRPILFRQPAKISRLRSSGRAKTCNPPALLIIRGNGETS